MLKGLDINISSLDDFSDLPEIREDGRSYRENALKKARFVSEATGEAVLADDSGLEVDALDGAPGIYSARYAGDHATDKENIMKLLADLQGVPQEKRGAAYHCVLVFYRPGGAYEAFTGHWEGRIHDMPLGEAGFGYAPVFFLPDRGITVGQLPLDVKNRISHRGQALRGFKKSLEEEGKSLN